MSASNSSSTALPAAQSPAAADAGADGPIVGLVMGSDSDWPVMEAAAEALAEFGIPFEADVVSRAPHADRNDPLRTDGP